MDARCTPGVKVAVRSDGSRASTKLAVIRRRVRSRPAGARVGVVAGSPSREVVGPCNNYSDASALASFVAHGQENSDEAGERASSGVIAKSLAGNESEAWPGRAIGGAGGSTQRSGPCPSRGDRRDGDLARPIPCGARSARRAPGRSPRRGDLAQVDAPSAIEPQRNKVSTGKPP